MWREGFRFGVLSDNYEYEVVEIAAGGDSATLKDGTRDSAKLAGSS
jgi:hypothetical protein